jgi:hypothetical protein
MSDQQDRALRRADQLHGFGHLALTRGLVDKPVPAGRQRIRHVQLLENDVRRVLDIGRAGCAGHGPADCLVNDLIGLVGVLYRTAVLDRWREKAFLLNELDTSTPDTPFGDAGALAAEEDHRRVLYERTHHRAGDIGHAGSERANAQARLTRHARHRISHESRAQFVMRCNHRPAARFRLEEHVHEVRVGDTEQRIDSLGLE